jgi:HPt (histidine-containing phosphotransfer) domain-containing protein
MMNASSAHGGAGGEGTPAELAGPAIDALRHEARASGPDLFGKLLAFFRQEAAESMALIERAMASGDTAAMRLAAHKMKGSAGTLGARALTALCAALEREPDVVDAKDLAAHVAAIRAEIPRVLAALEMEARSTER